MMKRALSLRESGRRDAAWALFEELRGSHNTKVVAWVEEESERFGWQTQRWSWLVDVARLCWPVATFLLLEALTESRFP